MNNNKYINPRIFSERKSGASTRLCSLTYIKAAKAAELITGYRIWQLTDFTTTRYANE